MLYCDSASSTFLHGLSGRIMLNLVRHTNLCVHNSENYMILWVDLFSCILTLVYQLIVKSSCALELIDAYYSCGPASHSIPEWLGETNSSTSSISGIGSKHLYSADQNANPASGLFYLEVLPSLYQEYHGNCTPSYEFLMRWYCSPSLFTPRSLCCCNRNVDKWFVMCEINTPSNLVAW